MAIYAIGDLHLSLNNEKPMDIFGTKWENHAERIKESWLKVVKPTDTILLLGDLSWKMHLKDMYEDFKYLEDLPGKKIIIKGNHDYWWETLGKMRKFLEVNNFESIDFLYNNSYDIENKIIVGTRGWAIGETENAKKMNNRELERLKLSLNNLAEKNVEKEFICIMHYPPIIRGRDNNLEINSNYIDLMKEHNVKKCLYAHLHGDAHNEAFEGIYEDIDFKLVSSDYLNFKLYKLN